MAWISAQISSAVPSGSRKNTVRRPTRGRWPRAPGGPQRSSAGPRLPWRSTTRPPSMRCTRQRPSPQAAASLRPSMGARRLQAHRSEDQPLVHRACHSLPDFAHGNYVANSDRAAKCCTTRTAAVAASRNATWCTSRVPRQHCTRNTRAWRARSPSARRDGPRAASTGGGLRACWRSPLGAMIEWDWALAIDSAQRRSTFTWGYWWAL